MKENLLTTPNESEIWGPNEIRGLRCRLGWSQAEIARVLSVELATIAEWESGHSIPSLNEMQRLAGIRQTADTNADRAQRWPLADSLMRQNGWSQIHNMDIDDGCGD